MCRVNVLMFAQDTKSNLTRSVSFSRTTMRIDELQVFFSFFFFFFEVILRLKVSIRDNRLFLADYSAQSCFKLTDTLIIIQFFYKE